MGKRAMESQQAVSSKDGDRTEERSGATVPYARGSSGSGPHQA